MEICKDNFDGRINLKYVEEKLIKDLKVELDRFDIFEITDFFKEDLVLNVKVDKEIFKINLFTMYIHNSVNNFDQSLALRDALSLKTNNDIRVRDLRERRDVYNFIMQYIPQFKYVGRPKNKVVFYPDFVVDLKIGIEVHYEIDDIVNSLLNGILINKLIKYNNHHYKIFEVNILLSKSRYSFKEHMINDFIMN